MVPRSPAAADIAPVAPHGRRVEWLQWTGLLLPAASFLVHLEVGYLLVPWACTTEQDLWVHISGVLSIVLAAVGTAAAWRTGIPADRERSDSHSSRSPRTSFLGAVGLGMGAIFTLILIAQWIAAIVIGPCQ